MRKSLMIIIFIILTANTCFAVEEVTYELNVYLSDDINLQDYLANHDEKFILSNETVIQNLNASIIEIDSSYNLMFLDTGTGLLKLSNEDGEVELHVIVQSPVTNIKFEQNTISLLLGEIEALSYSLESEILDQNIESYEIRWKSSKEKVATISKTNYITTHAPGSTIITGTTLDGQVIGELEVTVIGHSNELKIKSEKSYKNVNVGEEFKLEAYFGTKNVSESIEWISLTPHTLKVDKNGVIMAIGEGRAVIKAQSSISHKNSTYELHAYSMIDRVEMTHSKIDFDGPGESKQLSFLLFPKDKSYPPILKGYTYTSSNNDVVEVTDNGLVTSKSAGIALISVVFDDSQKRATCTVEVMSSEKNSIGQVRIENIRLFSYDKIALIGEKIPINYTVTPSNAATDNISFNIPNGDNSQIRKIGEQYFFIPNRRGSTLIEVISRNIVMDKIMINVTSPIDSLNLSLSSRRIAGNNEEIIYVGEDVELLTRIYTVKGYETKDVYRSSLFYEVENSEVLELTNRNNKIYVKGLKKGKTEIKVSNTEGLHEETLWVDVENPYIGIATDNQVQIPIGLSYRPRVSAELLSHIDDADRTRMTMNLMDIKVSDIFISENFIDEEILYEKETLDVLKSSSYEQEKLAMIEQHENRLDLFLELSKNMNEGYAKLINHDVLRDRNNQLYKFYSIKDNEIVSNYPIKLLVSFEIQDTFISTESTILWTDDSNSIEIRKSSQSYNLNDLIEIYNLGHTLNGILPSEQVELLLVYMNHIELFDSTPSIELLVAFSIIAEDELLSECLNPIDEKVTKEVLLKCSEQLHKKYINRMLVYGDPELNYYYDLIDSDFLNTITLGHVNPNSTYYFGVDENVSSDNYYKMVKSILPLYDEESKIVVTEMTHKELILALARLVK